LLALQQKLKKNNQTVESKTTSYVTSKETQKIMGAKHQPKT